MNVRAYFVLVALLFGISVPAFSVPTWMWSHPCPTGMNVRGIHFVDNNLGWLVASEATNILGEIHRTTDGGATWTCQHIGAYGLYDIYFASAEVGWACGSNGTVLKTTNGGQNWSSQYTGSSATFHAVQFTDASNGTLAGENGVIYRTSNGGANWNVQSSGGTGTLRAVSFIDPSIGWIAGPSIGVLYTESGGALWQVQPVPGSSGTSRGVHFVDDQQGWVLFSPGGNSQIFTTTDGGTSWSQQYSGERYANDLEFIGASFGVAPCGTTTEPSTGALVTTNGGQTWGFENIATPPGVDANVVLSCVSLPSFSSTFAGGSLGMVFQRDGSGCWSAISSRITDAPVTDVCCIGESDVWASTYSGEVLHSPNGGCDWVMQSLPPSVDNLYGICFVNTLCGYACGHGSDGKAIVIKTVNGGSSWTVATPAWTNTTCLNSIDFANPDDGVAVGTNGDIYSTRDGGASWESIDVTPNFMYSVCFGGPDNGWAVGENGAVVSFDFASDSWAVQYNSATNDLMGVNALDSETAWAVGEDILITTQNGGTTWTTINQPNKTLNDVWFFDASNGYMAAYEGGLYRTTNGGYTLTLVTDPLSRYVRNFCFLNDEWGWGGGTNGFVFAFRDPLVGLEEHEFGPAIAPAGLHVVPNPVIGTSTIAFDIAEPSAVVLSLYDIAGRLVSTLVEGTLPAGRHEALVDGAILPPGVYLVRLEKGSDLLTGRIVVAR